MSSSTFSLMLLARRLEHRGNRRVNPDAILRQAARDSLRRSESRPDVLRSTIVLGEVVR